MSGVTLIAYHKSVSDRLTHEIRRYDKPDWNKLPVNANPAGVGIIIDLFFASCLSVILRMQSPKAESDDVTPIAYSSIIHAKARKIVEKKLRTQIFTSGFAIFSVFPAVQSAFLQNHLEKPPSKPVQKTKRGLKALFHPPSHRRG